MSLDTVLQRADIWRGSSVAPAQAVVATGFARLDGVLPGSGWPLGVLTEILYHDQGAGSVSLVLPALAAITAAARPVLWINTPHIPYAPTLQQAGCVLEHVWRVHPRKAVDGLWAAEQALRSNACGAVLLWLNGDEPKALRRLQLAAEASQSLLFVFRPETWRRSTSPAALRIHARFSNRQMLVDLIKRRGNRLPAPVVLGDARMGNGPHYAGMLKTAVPKSLFHQGA
ncbi:MAG: translesion DNA synthesis-associated protein ImuA [Gammaproteobacteria bacterium]|nr:translesion DNA synthesis-associated protein ImuA [Gammaproteobacteria bacterium]